ncbi:hypothetical protein N9W41_01140 [bacterium]|nr:hypothetical protein [bacterium]
MKINIQLIISLFCLLAITQPALAAEPKLSTENLNTQEMKQPIFHNETYNEVSSGVRFSYSKSLSSGNFNWNEGTKALDSNISGDVELKYNLSLGFTQINEDTFGFIGDITYIGINESVNGMRASANLAYGFSRDLYAFGGFNYHDLIFSDDNFNTSGFVGHQVGLGLQLNPMLGFNIMYIQSANSLYTNNGAFDGDYTLKSLEVSTRI